MYNKKIGILGGGQLGKMLCQAAQRLDLDVYVLDKNTSFPAAKVCRNFCSGDFSDYSDVFEFGKSLDIITVEIETVNVDALKELQSLGKEVHPDPYILEIINDKGIQKQMIASMELPVPEYSLVENQKQIYGLIAEGMLKFPFVQKLRKGGYDGRAVFIAEHEKDLQKLLPGPSIIEKKVNIKKELSVLVSRNTRGEIACYPATEMIFKVKANLLDYQICPAEIPTSVEAEARSIAVKIASKLNHTGLLAVEMFVDQDNKIWLNELAPRPHNSGHYTIEASDTSQFEQHLRAILGLPLGSTKSKKSSILYNLLGENGFVGPARYHGIKECLALETVYIHIYGKQMTKPYRKMGHVTILDDDLHRAFEKLNFVKNKIKITT